MSSLEDNLTETLLYFSLLQVHDHKLIKNEDYHAREGDLCYVCGLLLYKSGVFYHCVNFSSAEKDTDCAHFFLHKTCALLPLKLKHPGHKNHVLFLEKRRTIPGSCHVCGIELKWFAYYCYECPKLNRYQICLACILPLTNTHISTPYHAHKLTLVPRLSNFQCDVCHSVDTDFSYMCYTCPFWIHLGCSKLQTLLECEIHHKHPLTLAYSLPQNYRSFPKPCRICKEELDPTDWLYYCLSCRFFAHTKCATSPPPNKEPDYPYTKRDFVQIPVPEHDPLLQQCIKKESISWLDDDTVTPPNHINHWSHNHQLLLKNKSELNTTNEEGKSPICNGCTDSKFTNDDVFFECRECNYVLHRHCAQFPKEMRRHMEGIIPRQQVGTQASVYDLWSCTYCGCLRNGIQMQIVIPWYQGDSMKLDIGCALLPREIKHQAHSHRLVQSNRDYYECNCIACNKNVRKGDAVLDCDAVFGLALCKFPLHVKCALKPLTVTHPWDPHPLHLIYSPDQIEDHPHEYDCEFCSQEIDADHWFYHCDVCDLSFHMECMDQYFRYSKVKFGATNIKIEAHQHGLTFVLNKKRFLPCQRCRADTFNQPVLQCTPCKFIQHAHPDLCS